MPSSPTIESLQREIALLRAGYADLLQAVSHDLRAPVRHISAFAPIVREALAQTQLSPENAEDVQFGLSAIEQAAAKLGGMTEALVRVCRASSAQWQLQPLDLPGLLRQEIATWQLRCPQVAVSWECAELSGRLLADSCAVAAMLQALLDNVAKFTSPASQPTLQVSLQMLGQDRCCLELRDNGVGFSAAQPQALGQMFRRMHRDSEFPGIGGGLALAKTVLERLGGEMELQAAAQQGCRVRLSLPLQPA